jgi:hypothetical protein
MKSEPFSLSPISCTFLQHPSQFALLQSASRKLRTDDVLSMLSLNAAVAVISDHTMHNACVFVRLDMFPKHNIKNIIPVSAGLSTSKEQSYCTNTKDFFCAARCQMSYTSKSHNLI